MNTYEEMYSALLKLCKKEGLQLIEMELEDEKIIYERKGKMITLNKRTDQLKRK